MLKFRPTAPPLGQHNKNSRVVIIAIVLFVFFDFAALALNFWLSSEIEQQAIAINLAGRQRMLSQRMVKVLLQIDNARKVNKDSSELFQELKLTFELFDNTLQGFEAGHETLGGANEALFLPSVKGSGARAALEQAEKLWKPYRADILLILAGGPQVSDALLQAAILHAEESNLSLLGLMNTLTTKLEQQTQSEASKIRLYQGGAFILALLNFFWAFMMYRKRIRAFSRSHNLLDEVINKISASVLVLDSHDTILKANKTAEQLFGYESGELLGKNFNEILSGNQDNLKGYCKNGTQFIALCERSAAMLDEQLLNIVTVLDVTQQRMTEEHLSALAYYDVLTRLPNRLLFDERLRLEVLHAQRRDQILAILYVDLDKFKPVNDLYGHEAGDQLLQDVAVRLKCCLRESDTVARRGGDEFTIIAADVGCLENCEKLAEIVISQMNRPFNIQNHEAQISCCIGISIFPTDAGDANLLINYADEAMYRAKQTGYGTYQFYKKTINSDNPD